jgi:hypothetical protein
VRPGRARSALAVTTLALAGCGSSASSSTTTTTPATTTTTSAQQAALQAKLLTLSDFPTGWARDIAANAATTEGTPTCLADVVDARGSTATVHAVFVAPSTEAQGALQTVASFPSGQAAGAVAGLKNGFLACNGTTFTQGEQTAHLATRLLDNLPTGPAGFAAEMELSIGTQHVYLDVFLGVTGDDATVLIWRSPGTAPALFATTAAKAMDRL